MRFVQEQASCMITVTVLYSPAAHMPCRAWSVMLPEGACVRDALQSTGFYQDYPEAASYPMGIFSTIVSLTHLLSEGDRIEIYRPLLQDPKLARRARAKQR